MTAGVILNLYSIYVQSPSVHIQFIMQPGSEGFLFGNFLPKKQFLPDVRNLDITVCLYGFEELEKGNEIKSENAQPV